MLVFLALAAGACAPPQLQGDTDAAPPPACECPAPPPDPTQCIRYGTTLSGGAQWLLDELQSGDATAQGAAIDALIFRMDAFETCAADLMDELNS